MKSEDKPQLDKFKEAARQLECDDDESHFRERLGRLAKAKAPPSKEGGASKSGGGTRD